MGGRDGRKEDLTTLAAYHVIRSDVLIPRCRVGDELTLVSTPGSLLF